MNISKKNSFISNLALALIIISAFFLRIYKIDHHLHGGNFFEESKYIQGILTEVASKVKMFNYPPFFDLILSCINKIYFLFYFFKGHFKNMADLITAFNIDYSLDYIRLLFVHRIVTAIIGTLTVPVLFLIAKNLFNSFVGLFCALCLAVIPLHVFTSIDAVGPDNFQLFFICLAFLYICKIFVDCPRKKYYILSGLFIGLAAATKYFGIFCVIPLLLAHFYSKNNKENKKYLYLCFGVTAVVLFITSFQRMIIHAQGVKSTLKFFVDNYTTPVSAYNTIYQVLAQNRGWVSYPNSLIPGLGLGIFIFSIAGLLLGLIRHSKKDILILAFPLSYYLFIGQFYNCQIKYILPVTPFLILLAGNFLIFVSERIYLNNVKILVLCLIICCLGFFSLKEAIYYKHWISQKPIEEATKDWILKNIPIGSYVLFDGDDLGDSGKLEPFLFYNQQIPYKVAVMDWKRDFNLKHFFRADEFDYVVIDKTRIILEKLKPEYEYIDKKFTVIKEVDPLFPTPRYHYCSIYGMIYNHSFKIYKNNKIR
jgi:hypothetical protein